MLDLEVPGFELGTQASETATLVNAVARWLRAGWPSPGQAAPALDVAAPRGAVAAILLTAALAAVMLPIRQDVGQGTSGLILVIPVVVGTSLGGWLAGLLAVGLGFLTYDLLYIPPYLTLAVSSLRDWATLGVYVVVALVVSQVVLSLQRARRQARRGEEDTGHLLAVAELLIEDKSLEELLASVVETVHREFRLDSAAVLLPGPAGRLRVVALAGQPIGDEAVAAAVGSQGSSAPLALAGRAGLRTLPLVTSQRPVGTLLLAGAALSPEEHRLLGIYANHAALAVERAQLREQALRTRLLSQVDSWRRALLGSVAHDLRTPLASIKAALSDLADDSLRLSFADRRELLATAEEETDHLAELVSNLLDMYRIEAGTRRLSLELVPVGELVEDALESMRGRLLGVSVTTRLPTGLSVQVDHALMVRVLVNLLDNAVRHTPDHTPVTIAAQARGEWIELTVSDRGPGLSEDKLAQVFAPSARRLEQGGVGLSICQSFVEAHGGRIRAARGREGGLELGILLPAA